MSDRIVVKEQAWVKRLNQAMAKERWKVKKARSIRMQLDVGDMGNGVVQQFVDLEQLADDWAVLKPWEMVAE
jgi:hypothetical protein